MYILFITSVQGGDYIPFADAPRILEHVVLLTMRGARIYGAFHPELLLSAELDEQNAVDDGVGELEFDHGLSE